MSSSSSSTQNQTRTSRMATRQHLADRAHQARVCFVLFECGDDPDISAYNAGQNVRLPPEATEHIPLTPTASTAVDTKNTVNFNERAMDDSAEPWTTEADHRPFAKKNVIRSGKSQLHPINTQNTRERRVLLIVELTLILFRVRSSTLAKQHVQLLRIVTKRWQIVYREKHDDHETTN